LQAQFRNDGTAIQWRIGGTGAWTDIVDLVDITGPVARIGAGTGVAVDSTDITHPVISLGAPDDVRGYLDTASYVSSRTALKALDTTKESVVYLSESGREGTFVFRSGDYSSQVTADTQEGIFVKATAVASTAGAWVREVDASVRANWFGAVGDGTTDDTAALQGAITVAELLGRTLQYGDGNFKITTALSTAKSIRHLGTGPLTSVIKPAGTISAFSHDGTLAPTFESLGVDYASAASSGTAGFNITSSSGEAGYFHAWNVRVHNAYNAFNFVKASQWTVDGCELIDSVQAGFFVQNTNNVDSGDSTIVNNLIFNPSATGSTSGLIWRSSGGLRFSNNKINNFKYGLNIQLASGASTGDLLITGNSIESVGFAGVDSGILIQRLGTTGTLHSVVITGNQLNGWATAIQVPLDATGPWLSNLSIVGNVIYGNTGAVASGVIVNSTTGFSIVGNTMKSGHASSVFLTTGSSAADGFIASNSPTGSFASDSLASTNTTVITKSGNVASLAGLTGAANKGVYFTAAATLATYDLTSFALTLLAASSAAAAATVLGLGTGNSPQFSTIELGNASDTTLSRSAAGVLAVEGQNVIMGALGSTTNALLRANGTGGVTAQGSTVTVDGSGNVAGVGTLSTTGVVIIGASSGGTYNGNTHFTVSDQFPNIQWLSGVTAKTQLICNVNDASMYFDAAGGFNIRDSLNGTTVLLVAPSLITASKPLKLPSYTVATLPAAGTAGAGAKAFVTDSNATTFAATVAGGGSNKITVTSDGTNWKIG
jgi:hypothetical protein